MVCCAGYPFFAGGETVFEVDASHIKYGSGALAEVGFDARAMGIRRVGLITDARVATLSFFETVRASLRRAGCDVALFDQARVEPTDASFTAAAAFAREARCDGFVSVGGGSAIDTAKAANLYSSFPADFAAYVNAPIGRGEPVPGPLRPHIACPTTCGTGAEVTAIAIFDDLARHAKTGIVSKHLRPTLGVIDPDVTASLPPTVVACSGFDVLSHALESYTALRYTSRAIAAAPAARPTSQGANPFSDIAAAEALRLVGRYIVRAVTDANDAEARERMLFAATLAGIGFGNAGVHIPHAMSYAVAGLAPDFHAAGYPDTPLVPHGMAVIVNTPGVVRYTAPADPKRHRDAAALLGADASNVADRDAGEVLAARIARLMRETGMPSGIAAFGFGAAHVGALRDGAAAQRRLLANAPLPTGPVQLDALFTQALAT